MAWRAPTHDYLLVFHFPNDRDWRENVSRMIAAGYEPVVSLNP